MNDKIENYKIFDKKVKKKIEIKRMIKLEKNYILQIKIKWLNKKQLKLQQMTSNKNKKSKE